MAQLRQLARRRLERLRFATNHDPELLAEIDRMRQEGHLVLHAPELGVLIIMRDLGQKPVSDASGDATGVGLPVKV